MANLTDLSSFWKPQKDLKDGDLLEFVDAGGINEVDFSPAKDGSKIQKVFQIDVRYPDGRIKTATPNKTSRDALSDVYGNVTEKWIGKQAKVTFVEQLSFGKMAKVTILRPVE